MKNQAIYQRHLRRVNHKLTVCGVILCFIMVAAPSYSQEYISKEHAIKKLSNAYEEIKSQYTGGDDKNYTQKMYAEKMRFIRLLLTDMKKGSTLEEAVHNVLPKNNGRLLQSATRNIDKVSDGKSSYRYIRQEIFKLITY